MGRLGKAALAADNLTTVYQVPAAKFATVNINICNPTSGDLTVKLAIASTVAPAAEDWVEHSAVIQPGTVLQRTADVLSTGERLIAHSDDTGAVIRVFGFEEDV